MTSLTNSSKYLKIKLTWHNLCSEIQEENPKAFYKASVSRNPNQREINRLTIAEG